MRFPLFPLKIALAVCIPAVAALLLALLAVSRLDALSGRFRTLEAVRLPRADLAVTVERQLLLAAQAIRGYALSADRESLERAKKDLAKAADVLHAAQEASSRPGMEDLAAEAGKIGYFLDAYKKAAESSVVANERVAADRDALSHAAGAYADAVAAYAAQKTAQWDKELAARYPAPDALRQHAKRLKSAQTAANAGRDVIEAAAEARGDRDPALLAQAQARFDAAEAALRDTAAGSDDDGRRLTPAFSALSDYRQAVTALLTDWEALRETGRKILEAERAALSAAAHLGGASLAEAAGDAGGLAGSLRTLRILLASAGWGIVLLGLGFAVVVAVYLGLPVRRCAAFARDLSLGRVTGTLAVAGRDEVAALAESLREMARRLGKRLAR
jgi:HAMP domain-containing protein